MRSEDCFRKGLTIAKFLLQISKTFATNFEFKFIFGTEREDVLLVSLGAMKTANLAIEVAFRDSVGAAGIFFSNRAGHKKNLSFSPDGQPITGL